MENTKRRHSRKWWTGGRQSSEKRREGERKYAQSMDTPTNATTNAVKQKLNKKKMF